MDTATGDKLYHVKSHGVTRELTANFNEAFTLHEELLQRLGKYNVQFFTIIDTRTPAQKHPAKHPAKH